MRTHWHSFHTENCLQGDRLQVRLRFDELKAYTKNASPSSGGSNLTALDKLAIPGMISFMLTIGRMARLFGLSRSTLLYYDSIGLFSPSLRSAAGYRLYSESDKERLEQIVLLRDLGIPLGRMRSYLEKPKDGVVPLLLQRVFAINNQIQRLKIQQRAVLALVEADGSLAGIKSRLHQFEQLGKGAGITEANYREIHRVFERATPATHRRFLRYLGFSAEEIDLFVETLKSR